MKVVRVKNSNKINARLVLETGDTIKLERKYAESLVGKELPEELWPKIEPGDPMYLFTNTKNPFHHPYAQKKKYKFQQKREEAKAKQHKELP
jgi:hypothetical protein